MSTTSAAAARYASSPALGTSKQSKAQQQPRRPRGAAAAAAGVPLALAPSDTSSLVGAGAKAAHKHDAPTLTFQLSNDGQSAVLYASPQLRPLITSDALLMYNLVHSALAVVQQPQPQPQRRVRKPKPKRTLDPSTLAVSNDEMLNSDDDDDDDDDADDHVDAAALPTVDANANAEFTSNYNTSMFAVDGTASLDVTKTSQKTKKVIGKALRISLDDGNMQRLHAAAQAQSHHVAASTLAPLPLAAASGKRKSSATQARARKQQQPQPPQQPQPQAVWHAQIPMTAIVDESEFAALLGDVPLPEDWTSPFTAVSSAAAAATSSSGVRGSPRSGVITVYSGSGGNQLAHTDDSIVFTPTLPALHIMQAVRQQQQHQHQNHGWRALGARVSFAVWH